MDAGEVIGVNDIGRVGVDDHLLIRFDGVGFPGGDEGGANVSEVGPHGLGSGDGAARGNAAGERQRSIPPFANLLDQSKRRGGPAWPPAPAATAISPSAPLSTA